MRRPDRPRGEARSPESQRAAPRVSDRPPGDGRRSAELTRERILDSAEGEFAAQGFAGARLRVIAEGAGVQTALIHHYFADKLGLYEAVVSRALDQLSSATWKVLGQTLGLEGYLVGFVEFLVDFYASHQNLLAIMRRETASGSDVFSQIVRQKTEPIITAVVRTMELLVEKGEIRRDVPPREILVNGVAMILYPLTDARLLEIVLPGPNDPATHKRALVAMLLTAIRPPVNAKRRATPTSTAKKRAAKGVAKKK